MVVCVKAVIWKNNLLVKFKYGDNRYISASSLSYILSKYEFFREVDDTIYDLPVIGQIELLTMDGDTFREGYGTFLKGIYLFIFLFFFC